MAISEHAAEFGGKPVRDYDPASGIEDPMGADPRLRIDYDSSERGASMAPLLERSLTDPACAQVSALVIGAWYDTSESVNDSSAVVARLVAACDRLAGLRALFLGDITYEECELTWIRQSDVTPLLRAFPALEELRVRGAGQVVQGSGGAGANDRLRLEPVEHAGLRSLIFEAGCLPSDVSRGVAASRLPVLEHLELWLGDHWSSDCGESGDTTVEDLAPILSGEGFPSLRSLAIRNSRISDGVAIALAGSPLLRRLEVLDLSLGTLGDEGALALLRSGGLAHLRRLDIHHHYVSDEVVDGLKALGIDLDAAGRDVDWDEEDEEEGERYIAISE
jgi:hypothetical protein